MATALLLVLVRWRTLRTLPRLGYVWLVGIPVAGWLVPLLVYVWRFPGYNPRWYVFSAERPTQTDPPTAIGTFFGSLLPLLFSGRPPQVTPLVAVLISIVLVAFGWVALYTLRGRSASALVALTLTVSAVGFFVFSSFGFLGDDFRYVLPLLLALPLLVAGALAALLRQNQQPQLALGLLLAVLGFHACTWVGTLTPFVPYHANAEALLAEQLEQQGIQFIHTSYWVAVPVQYQSGGAVVASSLLGPSTVSYDKRNEARVIAAAGHNTAFVVLASGVTMPALEGYFAGHAISCVRSETPGYIVYRDCTPFPNLADLFPQMPTTFE